MIPKFSQFKKINETINKDDYETIEQSLNDFEIQNYEIIQENGKFIVNVNGDIKLRGKNLNRIPFNFGIVSGGFYCTNNQLTSLEGAPNEVGGDFYCRYNPIKFTVEDVKNTKIGGGFKS